MLNPFSPNPKEAHTIGQLTVLYNDTLQALLGNPLRYVLWHWVSKGKVDAVPGYFAPLVKLISAPFFHKLVTIFKIVIIEKNNNLN